MDLGAEVGGGVKVVRQDAVLGRGAQLNGGQPELRVKAKTHQSIYTRHEDWEERILKLVELKLRGKAYGAETKPTEARAPQPKPAAGEAK